MKTFSTIEAALSWMFDHVDDSCIDNVRWAWVDDPTLMDEFERAAQDGCCGSFSSEVEIGGRKAIVGCNYGH